MKSFIASFTACTAVALLPAAAMAESPQRDHLENPNPQQLLYVGNSYLYYNDSLHNYVKRMVAEAHPDIADQLDSKSATISGAHLYQHEVKSYLFPGALGYDTPFDAVVLQGHSSAALSDEGRKEFRQGIMRHNRAIEATGAETILYMTPAYGEDHDGYDPDMIDKVDDLYTRVGNEIGALVIPVGLAFQKAYEKRPDMALHVDYDGSHPTQAGTYLAASTVFAALYDTSVEGNPYTYYGRVDKNDAAFLQKIAEETVEEYYSR